MTTNCANCCPRCGASRCGWRVIPPMPTTWCRRAWSARCRVHAVEECAGKGIKARAALHTDNQHRNASGAGTGDTSNPIDDDELRERLPALRRFARWLARDPADADDLVQACMERALSRWSTRRGDGSLKAWLFAIAHRQFIDQRQIGRAHV